MGASAAVLLCAAGCGETANASRILTNPRALAIRVEIIEEGPNSVDLIPIPADRVRSQPLPQDTIELQIMIADATGIRNSDDFDPRWFVCPSFQCTLGDHEVPSCLLGDPSVEVCELEQVARPQLMIPALDASDDVVFTIGVLVVAGVPGARSTDECVQEFKFTARESFEGCVLGWTSIPLGPVGPLIRSATAAGGDLSWLAPEVLAIAAADAQPGFHPEIVGLALRERLADGSFGVEITATSEATLVPPRTDFLALALSDQRDRQQYVLPSALAQGSLPLFHEGLAGLVFWTGGEASGLSDVRTGEPGERFETIVVLSDSRGGIDWRSFKFEVQD